MNEITKILGDGERYMELGLNLLKQYGPSVIGAIATIWIGFKVIKYINAFVLKLIKKSRLDPMLESFTTSIISVSLKILVFISAAGMLGVQTTSFVALIGAAGLAVGMALSGTMQNFAGGVMILLLKPYELGDYIEAGGEKGFVREIHIFNTLLETIDKKSIIIPNSKISNDTMVNYTQSPERNLDIKVGIDYGDNIDLAKDTLKEIIKNNKRVLRPEYSKIVVDELGDNAVILLVRVSVKNVDYFPSKWELTETIKKTFDEKGLNFPFPQRQIHMTKEA